VITISEYNKFSVWKDIVERSNDIWEGNPLNIKLTEETIFLQTRFYNTNPYHNSFVMFNDINAVVGFLKYVFLPTAFETYLKSGYTIEYAIGDTDNLIDIIKEENRDEVNADQLDKIQSDIDQLNKIRNLPESDKTNNLEDFKNNYRNKWDKGDNAFCDFEIYYSPEDIIDNMIKGYGEENMLDILEEQVGIDIDDIENLKEQVFEDKFLNKRFIDILNNKLESGLI